MFKVCLFCMISCLNWLLSIIQPETHSKEEALSHTYLKGKDQVGKFRGPCQAHSKPLCRAYEQWESQQYL